MEFIGCSTRGESIKEGLKDRGQGSRLPAVKKGLLAGKGPIGKILEKLKKAQFLGHERRSRLFQQVLVKEG